MTGSILPNAPKKSKEKENDYTHMEVILKQLSDKDFSKCTPDFQYGVIDYLVKFMNKHNGQHDEKTWSVFNRANRIIKPLGFRVTKRKDEYWITCKSVWLKYVFS